MRYCGIWSARALGRITLRQYYCMMKAVRLRNLDSERDMHMQAWLNARAGDTETHGKKTQYKYKNFKSFFDYKKLEDRASVRGCRPSMNELTALVLRANTPKGGG